MSATRHTPPSIKGQTGSLLLEVLVATMLVALLAGPLAGALARTIEQARASHVQKAAVAGVSLVEGGWGPRVLAAWWQPGPVLNVRLSGVGEAGSACRVGIWASGWLIDDATVAEGKTEDGSDADPLRVGPQLWSGLEKAEVVVRVRGIDGHWGPPWRLVVPPLDGSDPPPAAAAAALSPESVVVHRPHVGSSWLNVSWSFAALRPPAFGLLFPLAPQVLGWAGSTLDGGVQWWRMEEGRGVDVYY